MAIGHTPTKREIDEIYKLVDNEVKQSKLPGADFGGPGAAYRDALFAAELTRRFGEIWAESYFGAYWGTIAYVTGGVGLLPPPFRNAWNNWNIGITIGKQSETDSWEKGVTLNFFIFFSCKENKCSLY